MAKYIISTDDTVYNVNKFLAILTEENVLFGMLTTEDALPIEEFKDEKTAKKVLQKIIRWLSSDAFTTFEIPMDEDGEI